MLLNGAPFLAIRLIAIASISCASAILLKQARETQDSIAPSFRELPLFLPGLDCSTQLDLQPVPEPWEDIPPEANATSNCSAQLDALFPEAANFPQNSRHATKATGKAFALVFFGEAFRAPCGHQRSRAITNDPMQQQNALLSIRTHIVEPWQRVGFILSRIISHTYSTSLDVNLRRMLESTFKVPVKLEFSEHNNLAAIDAVPKMIQPSIELLDGEHALILRYDLVFFSDLPPPNTHMIMYPHCNDRLLVPGNVYHADSFGWFPRDKLPQLLEYLQDNKPWHHSMGGALQPFDLFYRVFMQVDSAKTPWEGLVSGDDRPYDLMGRSTRTLDL